jgi:L-seryl-tRNA(Ser) seleniumtransferase
MITELLRKLPAVDPLKQSESGQDLILEYGEDQVTKTIQKIIDDLRNRILAGEAVVSEDELSPENILKNVDQTLGQRYALSLQSAVNATGVILHTGLGRAALPEKAQNSLAMIAEGYSTLATDIESGRRSHRDTHLEELLCQLTGAEAATVVNNNAAATMLILNTLAQGREVIVSRGQLVEIGGAFRMPDVMAASGAILREVGTTNKTHLRDYAGAVDWNTAAIMRVHHSNYRIVGFASEPAIEEMAELAHRHDIAIIDDLGSGALVDLQAFGIEHEPLVQDSVRAGVDVACFSGDKLIGGPQAGIIVGKKDWVEKIRKNPLARAFRIGKLTITAMEATLKLFLQPDKLTSLHPVYRMFSLSKDEIAKRAKRVKKKIADNAPGSAVMTLLEGGSQVGSGAVPMETIPTMLLKIVPVDMSVEAFARKLRKHDPPIFARVQKDVLLVDLRTVADRQDGLIAAAVIDVLAEKKS